jgi:3-hydroxybutyrate dehydrogenase
VSVAGAGRRFSYGLVAAAMIWSLKLTCRWHELGTSVWVKGGAEVADQARRERGAPIGGGPGGPLSGCVAIVTGAAGGLGSATVRALRQAGATVVPVDMHGDDCLIADVATAEGNRRMVDLALARHGRLDILVLNAGAQAMNPIASYAEADWDRLMNLMVKGPFLAMKFAWPQLTRQPGGRIIVTSSTAGLVGAPYKAAYVAAKHAVLGLVKVAALEGAEAALTANAVAPGWMRTPLAENQLRDHMRLRGISRDDAIASMMAEQPARRFVDTTEVAGLIAFLAGPAGSAINGACIPVDTGTLAG